MVIKLYEILGLFLGLSLIYFLTGVGSYYWTVSKRTKKMVNRVEEKEDSKFPHGEY